MTDVRRDAALATLALLVLLGGLATWDALPELWDVRAVAGGLAAGVAVELAFVALEPAEAVWNRPMVPVASAVGLVAGGVLAGMVLGPVVLAAACWGLVTYFATLVLAVLGRWPVDSGVARP